MAGPLGRLHRRASTIVVGLAACVCAACVGALTLPGCATQPSEPLEPTVHTGAGPAASASATDSSSATSDSSSPPAAGSVGSTAPLSSAPSASAVPSASASGSALAAVGAPVQIEVGEPRFTSGEVPKAQASLEKLAKKFKACIDDNGGLTGPRGELEISFLVRAAGQAEGADVAKAKGIGPAASKCIRDTLKKKAIGTPSDDPIGVTVLLKLTPSS